ncbi:MAG: PQQ-binding-like beta-propeller repeat protein, partial [Pirellulales bacterium]|nr:PQQ-binding-like beta-propeller repeat protein [Pirellulales bacterium]
MISAKIFLKLLIKKDLIPSDAIRKLRRQVDESPKPIPAEAVAKRLVKKGYLTPVLAKRLLRAADATERKLKEKASSETRVQEPPESEESNLGFAPAAEESEDEEDEDTVVETWEAELEEAEPLPAAETLPPVETPAASDVQPVLEGDILEGDVVEGDIVEGDVVMDTPVARKKPVRHGLDVQDDDGTRLAVKRKKGLAGLLSAILPHRKRERKENPWDSSLILIGGGALLVLIFGGGALVWLLFGQSGDQMLEKADEFYRAGAYTKAIDQYDTFLSKYPGHAQASLAKVRRGLARLRQAVEMTTNPAKSLEVAKEVLDQIKSEKSFGEAKSELKSLLPTIAKGLSDEARQKSDPALVAKTREAVKLVEEHIFKSQRPKALLDDIAASLQITERAIARDDELAKAVKSMDELIEKGEPERAYNSRRMLLKSYPDLIDNKQLHEAILRVSDAQQAAVKIVQQAKPAEVPQPDAADKTAVAIARRDQQGEVPGASGHIVYALAEGAAYGLDAATGQVLWRRFVGYGAQGASLGFVPIPVSNAPGSDALVVDGHRQALVRVEATTGRVRWQQVLGEAFSAHPVLDKGNRVLVATSSGRLVTVNLVSGESSGFIQIPQKLTSAPAIDVKGGRIYQVAEHSNLYVLSPEGKCEDVVYLAHEPGTVTAAPVIISRLLVIAENRGYRSAVLRVFSLEGDKDTPAFTEVQQIEIEGHVDAPPLVSGTRMLATTDSGRVVAYRVSGTNKQQPLEQVAQLKTSDEPNLIRFPLLVRDQFFVADKTLSKYELQSSLGNFRLDASAFDDSVFLQPLTSLGQTIIFVRRRMNLPGVQVAAVAVNKLNLLWETNLAVPLVEEPV